MGRGRPWSYRHSVMDRVMAYSQDAFYLMMILKRHHGGVTLFSPSQWLMQWDGRKTVESGPQLSCEVGPDCLPPRRRVRTESTLRSTRSADLAKGAISHPNKK